MGEHAGIYIIRRLERTQIFFLTNKWLVSYSLKARMRNTVLIKLLPRVIELCTAGILDIWTELTTYLKKKILLPA